MTFLSLIVSGYLVNWATALLLSNSTSNIEQKNLTSLKVEQDIPNIKIQVQILSKKFYNADN